MAGLPPGDPQLVSMIVNHLKTQGLFDQFRRDCLADVDTKPAYLNLKQRVDNFVSNHLSNHTWSPHLNKNQLRNNIRQLVLQSGMLEQGVDRIVAQVVDPKINHTFRPQVERVVREFLSPGCYVEEPAALPVLDEEKPAHNLPEQASSSAPTGDAMSILETITTLNQEASSWASSSGERNRKGGLEEPIQELEEGEQDMNVVEEGEENQERTGDEEPMLSSDFHAMEVKKEDVELPDSERERLTEEMKTEDEESGTPEQADEGKDKFDSKTSGTPKEEGQALDVDPLRSPSEKHHMKQKARERLKEEYSLEDSDLEGLSDITVSSVHTSDLSSFEEESDDDLPPSDSSEDGEVSSDGDKEEKKQTCTDNEEDKERKPRRQAYVHKPFLYSRYYSDSDDEVTVEQRRRSAAKDKEERLLKRQQNRERMEEKRKQRAAQLEEQNKRRQETASLGLEGPRAKEARKERKVLEKKMALSRKRKRDSRKEGEAFIKKKGDSECEYTKKEEGKAGPSKSLQPKSTRKVSESASLDERRRRKSGSTSEDSVDPRKADRSRTHSFILDLEHGSEESLKQRPAGKFDRLSRKELHPKERKDKERSLSDERAKLKQKSEKRVAGDGEESLQKELKVASDDKGEKKIKVKSDKRSAGTGREGRAFVSESLCEEASHKDMKKGKATAVDAAKVDKEREKDKEKGKEKDKAKEKDKMKGEKASMKSDLRPLLRDSAGSSEERSDMEPGADGIRRREKPPKDVLKRSRSHNEDTEKTRQVEKGKIRSEAKDGEKEKPKGDDGTQDSQKSVKASSELEKDPRRSKEEQAAKGKATEKCRSKSKEDVKVPSSSKVDKKVQSADARTKGGTPTGKPDTLKDRKKDMGGKAHRRGSEENLAERNEDKSSKKPEKKIKILEKKGESQEEAKGVRGDDRSDKSSTPSVSSPVLETPESSRTSPQPKDACADPDPSVAIVTPSVLDDTYDALSDITPEPDDEDDAVKRLSEVEPSLPAPEANALLTLMDICTSEDARLVSVTDAAVAVQGGQAEDAEADGGQPLPELAFQDADLKMKEAALTLLSMDPESIVSSSVATQKEAAPAPQQVETAPSEGGDWHGSVHVQEVVEHPAEEGTQEMHVPVTEPEREDASSAEVTEMVISNVQPLDELGQQKNVSPNEEKVNHTNVTPDKPEESLSVDSGTLTTATEKEHDSNVEEATEEMVVEPIDPKIMIESEDTNKDQEETLEEKDAPVAGKCLPLQPEEVRETRRGRPSKLQKQTSNASKSDGQEDEKESDLSEKEGRGTRKRKLSNQKTGMPKDSAEENKEQETQEDPSPESVEESDIEKAQEPTARRRGRSSKASVDEDDQPAEQPEKVEETRTRRGRRSGAPAKETPASGKTKEKKDEEKAGGASTEKPQEKEEKATEKIEPKKPGRRGRPPKAQAQAQATEKAEKSESKETAGVCKPSRKRKRSEEREETSEETQPDEKEVLDGESQPQEENLPQEVTESQSEDQEDRKQEGSSETKTDKVEEDKDKPQKKPGRRGRPSKGADVTQEDPEKKDKPDGKEGEAKEEEEGDEEDEEEEGEEGGTKRRTTTRLAARLEAERNKPSKPSTRASRLGGKEESATSTRGTRGQAVVAAAKGGRKREASPPAPRTRGGQKLEEPPSKRAKR